MMMSNEKKEPLRFSDPSDRVAKKKRKKAGIISFALSGAMVLGLLSATFLPKPESAKAFDSLPEIETIKSTLTGSGKALKILEVVENRNDAVFGYYVEGQEPKDLEKDVLSGSHSNAERTQAASNYFVGLANNGILGVSWIHGAAAFDMPLSATVGYTEYYPWENPAEDYVTKGYVHELDTKGETVTVSGNYSNEGVGNGAFDLTGSSFEAVDSNGKYVQNIEIGETGKGAVFVPASEIESSVIKNYMFYKVALVPFYVGTDDNNEAEFYKEKDEESVEKFDFSGYDGKFVLRKSYGSDSLSYYGTLVDTSNEKNPLDREWIVSGDEREPYFILDTLNSDDEKPVSGDLLDATKKATVLAEDSGWYGISMRVPFKTVSESEYAYKVNFNIVPKGFIFKGDGNGQFNINVTSVEGTTYEKKGSIATLNDPEPFSDAVISYDKVNYAIEVTNNNLFLKYVLDCVDEDAAKISERAKSIQVDAVEASSLSVNSSENDFSKRGQHYSIADYDLIVFERGIDDIPDAVKTEVLRVALENENDSMCSKAMIIEAESSLAQELMQRKYSKLEDKTPETDLTGRANYYKNGAPGYSYGYTDGNLFFYGSGTTLVTRDIKEPYDSFCYTAENSAFYGVISGIKYENVLRERAGSSPLEVSVDLGKAMRYILNYKKQRQQTRKTSVKILEIEPTDRSELRRSKVAYPDGTGRNAVDDNKINEFEPFVYDWFGKTYNDDTITLSTMSTYEFVGKIDDITEDYDLIYIGSDITDFHTVTVEKSKTGSKDISEPSGYDTTTYPYDLPWTWHWHLCVRDNRNENNTWTNERNPGKDFESNVPAEAREYRYFIWKEAGSTPAGTPVPVMYETEQRYWNGTVLYDAKYSTDFNDSYMDGLVYYNIGDYGFSGEAYRAKGLEKNDDNNTIQLRYSGNDLTEKKLKELKAFADAGYPVVFADNLMNITSAGKTVNNNRVDVNSRMYSFISSVAGKANTYTSNMACLSDYSSKLMLQISLSKPSIEFVGNDGRPRDYVEKKPEGYEGTWDHNAIKNRTLDFTFKILNETDPTPLSTTYSLHLYIDRGADGLFSDDDEVEISSSDLTEKVSSNLKAVDTNSLMGSVPSSGIERQYILSRVLPDGVKGMVSWKLVVEKNGGGLHASEKGYAYTPVSVRESDGTYSGPITIKILQINTKKERSISDSIGTEDTYSLEWQDKEKKGPFGELFAQIEQNGNYQLDITTVTTDEVNSYYNGYDPEKQGIYYETSPDAKYNINRGDYNMLIIGFGDAYGELKDKTATAVTEFIATGKAVLFSHDNTAPCNNPAEKDNTGGHGYYFNTIVRDHVGLDRYGVTNDDTLFSEFDPSGPYGASPRYYKLGGSGDATIDGHKVGAGVLYSGDDLSQLQINSIRDAGYDIAYMPTSNIDLQGRNDDFAHGFTDLFIEGMKPVKGAGPYKYKYEGITDDMTGTMAKYETDTITMENEGQITKYPFNIETQAINDSFMNGRANLKVAKTHLQYYQMNMTSDDLVVWYCLGHNSTRTQDDLYSFVPNDVANQYYIFTRGNVTYSGCGHGGAPTHWVDPTTEEAKLFVNTMIAAYRAGYSAPEFKFVASPESSDNARIDTVVLPNETVGQIKGGAASATETIENDVSILVGKINFRFADSNLDAGRTMGLSDFEIIFPDQYKDKIYEPDDPNNPYTDELTFTHDNFQLWIDEAGHLKFGYIGDNGFTWKTSEETVTFYDSDGNPVQNGKFQTGKVYSLDIQELVEIFTKYTSRTAPWNYAISSKDHYRAPDTFPTEFTISVKPVTYFANETKVVADQPSTLTVTSLKLFDIG